MIIVMIYVLVCSIFVFIGYKFNKKHNIIWLLFISLPILSFLMIVGWLIYSEMKAIPITKVRVPGKYQMRYCPRCTEMEIENAIVHIDSNFNYAINENGILSRKIGNAGKVLVTPSSNGELDVQFSAKGQVTNTSIQRDEFGFDIVIWYGDPDGNDCILLRKSTLLK